MHKRRFLVELPTRHQKNREIYRASSCAPAMLSTGEPGVMNIIGNTLIVLSATEARNIMRQWERSLVEAEEKATRANAA